MQIKDIAIVNIYKWLKLDENRHYNVTNRKHHANNTSIDRV